MSPANTGAESRPPMLEADIYPGSSVLHERLTQGIRDFFGLPEDNQIRSSDTVVIRKYAPEPGEKIPPEGLTPYKQRCLALLMLDGQQPPSQQERIYHGTTYLQEPDARTLRIFETETIITNGEKTTGEKALAHINFSPNGTILEITLWNSAGNRLTSILRTSVETEERGKVQVMKIVAN